MINNMYACMQIYMSARIVGKNRHPCCKVLACFSHRPQMFAAFFSQLLEFQPLLALSKKYKTWVSQFRWIVIMFSISVPIWRILELYQIPFSDNCICPDFVLNWPLSWILDPFSRIVTCKGYTMAGEYGCGFL